MIDFLLIFPVPICRSVSECKVMSFYPFIIDDEKTHSSVMNSVCSFIQLYLNVTNEMHKQTKGFPTPHACLWLLLIVALTFNFRIERSYK